MAKWMRTETFRSKLSANFTYDNFSSPRSSAKCHEIDLNWLFDLQLQDDFFLIFYKRNRC